jgi:hypothetical protein
MSFWITDVALDEQIPTLLLWLADRPVGEKDRLTEWVSQHVEAESSFTCCLSNVEMEGISTPCVLHLHLVESVTVICVCTHLILACFVFVITYKIRVMC